MKTLEEVKQQLIMIKAMGFVKTHRAHDTGVGKTLEDLLSISGLHPYVWTSKVRRVWRGSPLFS